LATVYLGFFAFWGGENNEKHHSLRISGVLGCFGCMFWEFLKFWGGCIVAGWHIGDGIFGAVVEFCLLTSAGLFFLKLVFKKFNWKKLWKKWEEIVMRGAFILFLGSFLIAAVFVAPFLEYKKVSPTPAPPIPKVIAKPLPVKIIPKPEPPPQAVSAQQSAVVETQKQFEYFNANTGDAEDAAQRIAILRAETANKKEAELRQRNLEAQEWWAVCLPHYRRSLVVLHDILLSKAPSGDGIAQSDGYFQCLPTNMDSTVPQINVAEIGFQKNSNMNFMIIVTAPNPGGYRRLRISCSGGDLEFGWHDRLESFLHVSHIFPELDGEVINASPFNKTNEFIAESIEGIIAAQGFFLSKTNK
jgi:hypothetical protein